MPIYEYQCSCGNIFEKLESINSQDKEASCPKCGNTAKRKISLSSYHLTGSGFYNTDYKAKPQPPQCPSAGQASCCANCPSASK
ncbi:MAG: zinc ribbon domain-containing protein [Deferribacterales bacterium]|nr:zinc ribbon domain-containing protein [Deferribacterales bacterium]